MSGAIQKNVLAAAKQYDSMILYGAYIRGNAAQEDCENMLSFNAAPTLMDTWAVLRRTKDRAMLALNARQLRDKLQVLEAYHHVKGARLLKIGETEPWVVSNADSTEIYTQRFGIDIVQVSQSELAALYERAEDEQAEPYYEWFAIHSQGCAEPSREDLKNAARMAWALLTLLEQYQADGCALACFNLLKTGTTACLGVSYVNDCTNLVAACECDMDSAVTMLLMKKLTKTKLWMANPGLQPDGTINFSHCTGPICCLGAPLPYRLRSHHESGIGAALQIDMPLRQVVTLCRVSDNMQKMTLHRGVTLQGPYEHACRTQMHVKLENMDHYLATALGCHQVFAYEDITQKLTDLAALFHLEIL